MPVHSVEIKGQQPVEEVKPVRIIAGTWPVGVALLAFSLPMWLAGGKFTVEGWIIGLNWFMRWFGATISIPRPSGWWLLIVPLIAFVYSRIEVTHRPVWLEGQRLDWRSLRFAKPLLWAAWLLVVASDWLSTYIGVRVPSPDAFLITQQIAASQGFSGAWTTVLTFIPEWLIVGGLGLLRR